MSTSALTGRWPQRASRSTIHCGVFAVVSMPRTMRPEKRPHRSVASTRTATVSSSVGTTGSAVRALSGAPVRADTSRAMP